MCRHAWLAIFGEHQVVTPKALRFKSTPPLSFTKLRK
jgi:hypothetical protein